MEALTLIGAPPLLSDDEFVRVLRGTIARLNHLLKASYVVGRDGLCGPIGEMIAAVLQFHSDGERYARDWEAFRVGLFAMQLERLSKVNPLLLTSFRRGLRKISANEYFGFRFEVQTAMMLIGTGLPFTKREAPDFEITVSDHDPVYVECASTNLARRTDKDVLYKISSAIAKKARKPYCNSSTALLLDFTNVFYRSIEVGNSLNMDSVKSTVLESARQTPFGAVCPCAMIQLVRENKYAVAFPTIYRSEDANPALTVFLERFIPSSGTEHEAEHLVPFSM